MLYAFVVIALSTPKWFVLSEAQLAYGPHHTHHFDILAKDAPGFNKFVLKGVDKVQSTAPDGGGYFIGVKAIPAESPIGYPIKLGSKPLLDPPRSTSYCSGSSYAAFVEALNECLGAKLDRLSPEKMEAMRMQEPDGSRREDGVKMWGQWNADGPGSLYALVQFAHMGKRIKPIDARPGDFINISWKSGLGHSVVFLGWTKSNDGVPGVAYWSSQKGTQGFGDQISSLSKIQDVIVVRLMDPKAIFHLDPATKAGRAEKGDVVADLSSR